MHWECVIGEVYYQGNHQYVIENVGNELLGTCRIDFGLLARLR